MGQRLNIEIVTGKDFGDTECIANSYYHWSAYTSSSIHLLDLAVAEYDKIKNPMDNPVVTAIRMLAATGAGFTIDEAKNILGMIEKENNAPEFNKGDIFYLPQIPITSGRNGGLLSIDKERMDDTRAYEEGRVTINIETGMVDFEVWFVESAEEYEEECEGKKYEDLPLIDEDVCIFTIFEAVERLSNLPKDRFRTSFDEDSVYMAVE